MLCIHYLIQFTRNYSKILVNFYSQVNTITPAFAIILDLTIRITNVEVWKIDCSSLKTYSIVSIGFFLQDSLGRDRFVEEIIMMGKINMKVVIKMVFLSLSNANIKFTSSKWTKAKYTTIGKIFCLHISHQRFSDFAYNIKFLKSDLGK